MQIFTHRGLDAGASRPYFMESSREAFADQLKRGFGLEFDLQFCRDGQIIVFHDQDLGRITGGARKELFSDLDSKEILAMETNRCHFIDLDSLIKLISGAKPQPLCAVHIKSAFQEEKYLAALLEKFNKENLKNFIFFDLLPKAAEFLKSKNPELNLAPSVAHPYDIARYNDAVGGTLMSVEDALAHKDIYSWVWLDEWDLKDKNGREKTLLNPDVFAKFKDQGFKIALVTPELHAKSPGLLGGEAHSDGADLDRLTKRLKFIISLKPNGVCTDYPDKVKNIIKSN